MHYAMHYVMHYVMHCVMMPDGMHYGMHLAVVEQAHQVAVLAAVDVPVRIARGALALERGRLERHEVLRLGIRLGGVLLLSEPPPQDFDHDLVLQQGRGAAHSVADRRPLVKGAQVRVRREPPAWRQLAPLDLGREREWAIGAASGLWLWLGLWLGLGSGLGLGLGLRLGSRARGGLGLLGNGGAEELCEQGRGRGSLARVGGATISRVPSPRRKKERSLCSDRSR